MKYIIGRKVGMVQVFDATGKLLPVTVVQCEPNKVLVKKDNKIVIGYEKINAKKLTKPQQGFFKKFKSDCYKIVAEFDCEDTSKINDVLTTELFTKGEYIDVQGITRGHGYTGAIVRWNFKIGPKSHGAGYPHRYQGSIAFGRGGSQGQRVPKGRKMAGHYGHEVVTTQNLLLLEPISKWNVLLILGAIPGPKGGNIIIKSSVKRPLDKKEITIISKEIKENILMANEKLENKEALYETNKAIEEKEAKKEAQIAAQKQAEKAKKDQEAANKNDEIKK